MTDDRHTYDWRGHLIGVEIYEGECHVDAITAPAKHDTGTVPEGETHYLCELLAADGLTGFWTAEETFDCYAKPISPGAIEREDERGGRGYTGQGGVGVDITKFESADTGGGGGRFSEDDDARECPECDGLIVDALGGPRCDACGFEPEGDDA